MRISFIHVGKRSEGWDGGRWHGNIIATTAVAAIRIGSCKSI